MEKVILSEVQKLIEVLMAKEGQGPNRSQSAVLGQAVSVSVVNSIWTILTGQHIEHGDQTVKEIVQGINGEIEDFLVWE